jgi:hypothetical protein
MNWSKTLTLDGRLNVHNVSSGIIAMLVLVYWYIYMSSPEPPGYHLLLPLLFIFSMVTFLAFDSDRGETLEVIGEIVIMNIFYLPYRFIKEKNWEVTGRTLLLNGTSLFILTTIWLNQLNIEMGFVAGTLFKGLVVFLFLTVTILSRLSSIKHNYVEVKETPNFQQLENKKPKTRKVKEEEKEEEKRTYSPTEGEY